MDFLAGAWAYLIPFLVILTVLVFVHELGHYLAARRCGVRVEVFSIGFGPELFGWNDRHGTRWKLSALPFGGYVKMFGESEAGAEDVNARVLSPQERAVSFHYKPLRQRTAIVCAGPAANFVFAILVLAALFATAGQPYTTPLVLGVAPGSAAEEAGIRPGDVFLRIGGQKVERFEDIQLMVRESPGVPLAAVVKRADTELSLTVTPQTREERDRLGNVRKVGFLGVTGGSREFVRRSLPSAIWHAAEETYAMTALTVTAVGQMIVGTRTAEDLGGPLRIAQMSGEVAQIGLVSMIWFLAVLSINLGLINLFPIPVLDGGHLLFYAIEAIRGKPLGPRALEYGFRIGLALVLGLMVFATWNDLVHLKVFEFLKRLVT